MPGGDHRGVGGIGASRESGQLRHLPVCREQRRLVGHQRPGDERDLGVLLELDPTAAERDDPQGERP
mgnify:CR=1 FL=1